MLFGRGEVEVNYSLLLVIFILGFTGCAHNTVIPLHDEALPDNQLARLVLPEAVDLLVLDDKKLSGFSRPPLEVSYVMLPGEHELVLRYETMWPNDEYSKEVVASPLLSVKVNMVAGGIYRITSELPQNYTQARAFIKSPAFVISSAGGEASVAGELPPSQQVSGIGGMLTRRSNTPLDNLVYWWGNASEAEKAEFTQYIQENKGQ